MPPPINQEELEPGVAIDEDEQVQSRDYLEPGFPYLPPPPVASRDYIEPGFPYLPPPPVQSVNVPSPGPMIVSGAQGAPPPVTQSQLTAPVSPGDLPRSMRPLVMPTPGFNLEQWREQNAEMPIAQAEQAVASAMRFQGIRQYQQDLASGMTAAEALAKSAPLLFGGPKQGNLGQAASFIRATRPPSAQYRDIGGVLYKIPPGGEPQALTQRPTAPRRLDAIEQGFLKADLAKLKEVEDNPAFSMPNAMGEDLRRQAHDIRNKITIRYREQAAPVAQAPVAPSVVPQLVRPPAVPAAPVPAPKTEGKIFRDKSGKKWRYIGSAADPKTDRNESNWQEQ